MIRYLGKVNQNTYSEIVHELSEPGRMIAVQAKLVDGIEEQDLCLLQYSIIPRVQRLSLPLDTFRDSPVGPVSKGFVQYSQERSPIAAVRLKPLSGTWEFVVRELVSDELTLKEAPF